MKRRNGFLVAALTLAIVRSALAQISSINVSIRPQATCFNAGGTFQVEGDATNVSGAPYPAFQMGFCAAGASIFQPVAGSANQPPGGTSQNQSCPSFGSTGILFTANGPWPNGQKNTVLVDFAVSTSSHPASIPIGVSASDGTHAPVFATFSMPSCTAAGPVLQITKSFDQSVLSLGQARVGDYVIIDIVVTNVGTAPTTGTVQVSDTFPEGLEWITDALPGSDFPASNRVGDNGLSCSTPNPIPPGGSVTERVKCIPTKAGIFENTATVQGGGAPSKTSAPISLTAYGARPDPVRQAMSSTRNVSGRTEH